jgi:CHAT domain-containing protein
MPKLPPILLVALLAACTVPPPSAYDQGQGAGGRSPTATVLGRNTAGETCTSQPTGPGGSAGAPPSLAIYCGTWDQPSAEVTRGPPSTAAGLMALATAGPWRAGINGRFACATPATTTITGGLPAVLLSCTRRIGGWPQVALVVLANGTAYYADGVGPALAVMERGVGVLSGTAAPAANGAVPPSEAEALMARRLAAQSFSSGDIGQYQALMIAGTRANLAESFAAAEQAYRAALALQEKALGANNPNTVTALTLLALQISDQGRFAAADHLFARAATLAPAAADPAAEARLLHCEGLDALNQGKTKQALALLIRANAAYSALVPPEILNAKPEPAGASRFAGLGGAGSSSALARRLASHLAANSLLINPVAQSALLGVIETRRYQAVALRLLGRDAEAVAMVQSAEQLAAANGITMPIMTARLTRTAAATASARDDTSLAATLLARSATDFDLSLPRTAPVAETELLRAAALAQQNRQEQALTVCRSALRLLEEIKRGTRPDLLAPCLGVIAQAANRDSAHRQALLGEMFQASQLGQDSITSRQIAEASARLAVSAKHPKVATAIRERQNAANELSSLYRTRDVLAAQESNPNAVPPPGPTITTAELDKRIVTARARLAEADSALQAAAPNYGQLVQQVVSAKAVLDALSPSEAFAEITLDKTGGYVFVLAKGSIAAAAMPDNTTQMAKLVSELRASIEPTADNTLPHFDTAAAQRIYADTLGRLAPELADIHTLIVAPAGPLLAIPFGVLLTGPAQATDLSAAPWLLRRFVIAHVPAAANFVSLSHVAGTSHATVPWFGFGDFIPVTLAQAEQTFPGASCRDSAALFAGLPQLPYAKRELAAARALLGATPSDELLGTRFTVAAVMQEPLANVRVLHFATHAILPAELTCQSEPAIVTSDPAGAKNASGALLTSSDITQLNLDANVVILSACNTGGPGGSTAGESLSGLARAFFFAGARSLMVTHWSVNDQAAAYLVADALDRYRAGISIAAALRDAELGMLDNAGKSLPAALAAPFFWAPFAVIGIDHAPAATTADRGPPPQEG